MKSPLFLLYKLLVAAPARLFKRILPKSLFGRTLLIIVIPTFLTLIGATFVFFDRHWSTTTERLTSSVAGDIATVIDLLETIPDGRDEILAAAQKKMNLTTSFTEDDVLPRRPRRYASPLRDMLRRALNEKLTYPHLIRTHRSNVIVLVETGEGVYSFTVPQRRIYTPTTEVFVGWMIGSTLLLSIIALLFMRNQVRPVRRLADAAEAIGKGQDVPWFKPEGATEVRQASSALMLMRERLSRAMSQRTAMLAGVSHDLRTPLTRMRLQLAMMPETAATRGFTSDIAEMEEMLEAYLAFARGEGTETPVRVSLPALLEDVVAAARRQNPKVALHGAEIELELTLRASAMKRCLGNLIGNALRYGAGAEVTLALREGAADIFIDDSGPGIPEDKREEVFRAFYRLDASRNLDKGGVGLGLPIARDIARAHGGEITLGPSPMGGLRAHLWLPV